MTPPSVFSVGISAGAGGAVLLRLPRHEPQHEAEARRLVRLVGIGAASAVSVAAPRSHDSLRRLGLTRGSCVSELGWRKVSDTRQWPVAVVLCRGRTGVDKQAISKTHV